MEYAFKIRQQYTVINELAIILLRSKQNEQSMPANHLPYSFYY